MLGLFLLLLLQKVADSFLLSVIHLKHWSAALAKPEEKKATSLFFTHKKSKAGAAKLFPSTGIHHHHPYIRRSQMTLGQRVVFNLHSPTQSYTECKQSEKTGSIKLVFPGTKTFNYTLIFYRLKRGLDWTVADAPKTQTIRNRRPPPRPMKAWAP